MAFTCGWYVMYVKSNQEQRVYDSLLELNLRGFLPLTEVVKTWKDRIKRTLKPLFPSYVFVFLNSNKELYTALNVNGACAYIRFGKEYARVKDSEIKMIKLLIDAHSSLQITKEYLPKIGQSKIVSYGLLDNMKCEVINVKNEDKIVVRIESLRQSMIATVPLACLRNCS